MGATVSASIGRDHYRTNVVFGNHSFVADELIANGGADKGPTPSALIASSLASCTAITLRMYADRKGYDVEKIDVEVELSRKEKNGITHSFFELKIRITGNITDDERERLNVIATKCPTQKLMKGVITITSRIE